MKKLITAIAASLTLCGLLAGCKPSEEHYRAAYETAVAKRDEGGGVENTIYNRYRDMARRNVVTEGGDSLPVTIEYVGITSDAGHPADSVRAIMKPYNVVVGSFKQIFNATQMVKRLDRAGYDFPFVVHTREPLYYVVAETCGTPAEALRAIRRVSTDTCMRLRSPLPFVLVPAHLKSKTTL